MKLVQFRLWLRTNSARNVRLLLLLEQYNLLHSPQFPIGALLLKSLQLTTDEVSSTGRKGDSVTNKRIFVVDHMCALPYGHNQGSVALFRRKLAEYFTESHALVPRVLPDGAAKEKGFTRCLNYPYNAFYFRRFEVNLTRWIKNQAMRIRLQLWLRRMEKVVLTSLARLFRFDLVLWKTQRNWRELFKAYNIGADDLLFFPSADFYGATACLNLLLSGVIQAPPRLSLRMIGVMEHASLSSRSACDLLLEKVQMAGARGIDVKIFAETPAYAAYLTRRLRTQVNYFPAPMSGDHMPMPRSEPTIAASIGSGRGDRGYFLIADIVQKSAIHSRQRILFEIQSMPPQDHAFRRDYEATLASMPNVHILPSVLTDDEILDCYRRSYVAVLPYDPKVYERRGSAVYQEAIAFTRPVVCLDGTAFADLIERYQNGYVCSTVEDIVAAIDECASISPDEWDKRLTVTRDLYEMDVNDAIRQVLAEPALDWP